MALILWSHFHLLMPRLLTSENNWFPHFRINQDYHVKLSTSHVPKYTLSTPNYLTFCLGDRTSFRSNQFLRFGTQSIHSQRILLISTSQVFMKNPFEWKCCRRCRPAGPKTWPKVVQMSTFASKNAECENLSIIFIPGKSQAKDINSISIFDVSISLLVV